jgi:hypothetical protein
MQLDMTDVTKADQGGITAGGATPDRSISACSPGSLIKDSAMTQAMSGTVAPVVTEREQVRLSP